jgi:hypothetical protein
MVKLKLKQENANLVKKIPWYELCPWWWTRDKNLRPLGPVIGTLGNFRTCPETIDLIQPSVIMAVLIDHDIMGLPLPLTRKQHEKGLATE